MRSTHAANEGQVFSWANPPETGHPGTEPGCRCWAESYTPPSAEDVPNDPPIEGVYPELFLLPLLRIRQLPDFLLPFLRQRRSDKPDEFTEHGATRSIQRRITAQEALEAINSAKESRNFIEKTGKYGTKQLHYIGKNGVTVIVETEGRNAGKIITFWRH